MRPVIPCPSADVLRWFLEKSTVSVVHAAGDSWESAFPEEVRRAACDVSVTIDFALATARTIVAATGVPVSFGETAVFADGDLVGRLSDGLAGSDGDLLGAVLAAFQDGMHQERQWARRRAALVGLLKTALLRGGRREAFAAESPHEVLGIHPGASLAEARRARTARLSEYHPDRVTHLGRAIRDLAESQSRKINWAFDEIKQAVAGVELRGGWRGARDDGSVRPDATDLAVRRKRGGGRRAKGGVHGVAAREMPRRQLPLNLM